MLIPAPICFSSKPTAWLGSGHSGLPKYPPVFEETWIPKFNLLADVGGGEWRKVSINETKVGLVDSQKTQLVPPQLTEPPWGWDLAQNRLRHPVWPRPALRSKTSTEFRTTLQVSWTNLDHHCIGFFVNSRTWHSFWKLTKKGSVQHSHPCVMELLRVESSLKQDDQREDEEGSEN